MTRLAIPVVIPDAAAFARALGRALKTRHADGAPPPGHVEILNLVAQACGHRNLQSLRASRPSVLPAPVTAAEDRPAGPALSANARKALMQFDSRGRLVRWPNKLSVQRLAMWVLWTHFDGRRVYTEAQVNAVLRPLNTFGDHVTLRRELINHRLLTRKSDCSQYRKLPARPDDEARTLLAAWREQRRRSPDRRPQAGGPADP